MIDYQIVVSNDGNVDLTGVSVADPLLQGANGTLSGPVESLTADGILEVDETWTYTGDYTVQQADINDNGGGDGDIDNTATVSSDELLDEDDSEEQPITRDPQYSIDKTITGVDTAGDGVINAAGDIIDYQIVVSNDGNVDLTGVSVADPLLQGANGTLSGPVESLTADGILEVDETWTYTGDYTVQQADINDNGGGDGDIDNTATVSSDELLDEDDSEEQPITRDPQYSIDKTITGVRHRRRRRHQCRRRHHRLPDRGQQRRQRRPHRGERGRPAARAAPTAPSAARWNRSPPTASSRSTRPGPTPASYTVQQADINDNGGGDGNDLSGATSANPMLYRQHGLQRRAARRGRLRRAADRPAIRSTRSAKTIVGDREPRRHGRFGGHRRGG